MILLNIILFILILNILILIIYININKKKKKYIKNIYILNIFIEIFPILFFIFLIKSFIYEPFRIPSASMMPTLLIGDFILVNKFIYNIKNPLNNNTIININNPNYNDIVVFQYPLNKKINYIKRIIGLPGDKIIYNTYSKKIKIIKSFKKKYNKNIVKYSKNKISNFIEEIIYNNGYIKEYFWENKNINKNKKKNSRLIILIEKKEYIKNKNHNILLIPNFYLIKKNKQILEWIVPKNMYFVMGDYRDNSEDSRYWGFVDKKLLIGKAEYIWMSIDTQKLWPINIRLNRIGKIK